MASAIEHQPRDPGEAFQRALASAQSQGANPSQASCAWITTTGVFLGIMALVGHSIFPSLGAVRAVALGGFSILLSYAFLGITSSSFLSSVKANPKSAPLVGCLAIIVSLGVSFAALAGSQAICNSFLPHLSYTEALRVYWTAVGIYLGIGAVSASSICFSMSAFGARA